MFHRPKNASVGCPTNHDAVANETWISTVQTPKFFICRNLMPISGYHQAGYSWLTYNSGQWLVMFMGPTPSFLPPPPSSPETCAVWISARPENPKMVWKNWGIANLDEPTHFEMESTKNTDVNVTNKSDIITHRIGTKPTKWPSNSGSQIVVIVFCVLCKMKVPCQTWQFHAVFETPKSCSHCK